MILIAPECVVVLVYVCFTVAWQVVHGLIPLMKAFLLEMLLVHETDTVEVVDQLCDQQLVMLIPDAKHV